MKWLISDNQNVFYNLALEEYLCQNAADDDCFIIWTNEDSVVVGRNQNIFEEVNVDEAMEDGIVLARRNSGGGAVFHDSGNINFSVIRDFDMDAADQYDGFITPIIEMLHSLGVPASKRNKSDIVIMEDKISGNAQIIKGTKMIHHGTLLFDADLAKLRKYLKSDSSAYSSKATKSVKSSVVNIREYLDITAEEFKAYIADYFCRDGEEIILSEEEKRMIQNQSGKFSSWDWVIGRSPKFSARERCFFGEKMFEIEFFVEKGIIRKIETDFAGSPLDVIREETLAKEYVGHRYSEKYVREILENNTKMFI